MIINFYKKYKHKKMKPKIFLSVLILLFAVNAFGQNVDTAMLYYNNKNYQKAVKEFEKVLPDIKTKYGQYDTTNYSKLLIFTAKSYENISDNKNAKKYYLEAKSIYEHYGDSLNTHYATNLNGLAGIYQNMGKYKKAEPLYLKSLKIRKKIIGENSPSYASSLNDLATLYIDMGKYRKAESLLLKAIKIYKNNLGENYPDYASFLNNLAGFYLYMGEYKKAEPLFIKATEIDKKIFGKNNPSYATDLNNLGMLYIYMGEYQKAKPLLLKALKIRKNVLGDKSPAYAISLNNLAGFYKDIGEYKKAEPLFTKVLNIRKKILGENHPDYAQSLNNIANLYQNIGEYEKAEPLYEKAIEIDKKVLGENHPSYATDLNNLAMLYQDMGEYKKAEHLLVKVLEIRKRVVGEKHPYYAISLNNLSGLYEIIGEYKKAEPMVIKSTKIIKNVLGENHPYYAIFLNDLASLYVHMKQYKKAEPLFLKALEITKNSLGKNSPSYATDLNNLASLYKYMGKYKKAEALFIETIQTDKNILGKNHPDYASDLNNLAIVYEDMGEDQKAEPLFMQANKLTINIVKKNFSFMSDKQRAAYWNTQKQNFNYFNSFCLSQNNKYPELGGLAYDNALFEKGLLLRSSVALNRIILESRDTALINKYEKYKTLAIVLQKQLEKPINKRYLNTDSLSDVVEKMQKELINLSEGFGNFMKAITTSWQDIQKKLSTDQACIEYLTFKYHNGTAKTDSILYIAVVLRKNYKYPKIVYLCKERQIDSLFKESSHLKRDDYAYNTYLYDSLGTDFYNLAWKPIDSLLSGVKTVFYSPSGLFLKIPFPALPYNDSLKLTDKYQLENKTSTSNLLINSNIKLSHTDTIIIFGGINYNADLKPKVNGQKNGNRNIEETRSSAEFFAGVFGEVPYLPGAEMELKKISTIAKNDGFAVDSLSGANATEGAFKKLENRNLPIIHIATHGFYIDTSDINSYYFKDPMRRSGLLFAGANKTFAGENVSENKNDGILTAKELGQLNFYHTNLLVLSACQTALGDIKGDEGVFGLQRAVKMSGINYMVVSLWEVDDYASLIFMKNFYSLLLNGKSIEQSYKKSIKHLRYMGLHKIGNKYKIIKNTESDTYFWAPFVLMN
jgi:tetratricopeptide (TPR) repeat protein